MATKIKTLSKKKKEYLEITRQVLCDEGHAQFSMRKVANTAGVHLSTLQHHFPTKRDLLTQTFEYTFQFYYVSKYGLMFEESEGHTPESELMDVVDYLVDDLSDPFTARFFPEIWALSSRDPDAQAALDKLYKMHRRNLAAMILAVNHDLDKKTLAHRAAIIAMLIEGMLILIGHGKTKHAELEGIKTEIKNRVLDIAKAK